MADNTTLNAGTGGDTIATDDIAGVKYPIQKLAFGALDAAVLAVAGAGAVTTGTQRNTLASDDPAVVALQIMDDWDNAASDGASVSGDVAHDAADAGEPIKVGGRAQATAPTAVSLDGDRVNAWFLLNGAQATVLTAAGALIGGDAANGLDVDVTRLPALAAGTNNIGDVDVLTLPALPAGTNNIGDVDILSIAAGDNNIGNVDIVSGTITTVSAVTAITNALPAGTNAIGKLAANTGVDIGDVDVTSISAGSNLIGNVGLGVRTSGGMTIFRSIDLDETEEEVKATAGQVYSIYAFNTTNAILWLKFYNLTAANTTVGTSTPVLTFGVPGNNDTDGAGFVWNNEIGWAFGTAISVAATTAVADADTGAPGANALIVNIGYA